MNFPKLIHISYEKGDHVFTVCALVQKQSTEDGLTTLVLYDDTIQELDRDYGTLYYPKTLPKHDQPEPLPQLEADFGE